MQDGASDGGISRWIRPTVEYGVDDTGVDDWTWSMERMIWRLHDGADDKGTG